MLNPGNPLPGSPRLTNEALPRFGYEPGRQGLAKLGRPAFRCGTHPPRRQSGSQSWFQRSDYGRSPRVAETGRANQPPS